MYKLLALSAIIASVTCAPNPEIGFQNPHNFGRYQGPAVGGYAGAGPIVGSYPGGQDYYEPAKYNFGYGVSDPYHGTNFGHSESRNGHRTEGEYFVDLPDGRRQKVTYYADETGYHPTVTYEGVAHYPPPHNPGPIVAQGQYH